MSSSTKFLLAGLLTATACTAGAQTLNDPGLSVTPYVTGLSSPTQVRFTGNNDLFVTEKDTGLVKRVVSGVTTTVLDLNVSNGGERGLLGFTPGPQFAADGAAYAYYTATGGADGGAWTETRLSRFTWNGSALVSEQILRTFGTAADGQAAGPNHNGGPLLVGADGMLYGITGDLNRNAAEQNNPAQASISSAVGGIYRLDGSGVPAAGNPFIASAVAGFQQWYATGVRNSYGLAVDPVTGNLWDTENGPESYDEINLVAPGFNSGWNAIMGPDSRDPQGTGDLVSPGSASAYSDPEFSFLNPVALTGLTFPAGSVLGAEYDNMLLAGDSNNGQVYLLELNAARDGFLLSGGLSDLVADNVTERNLVRFGQDFGAITDLQIGPDGALYITSLANGIIYRVVPEPSAFLLCLLGAAAWSGRRRR